MNVRIPPRHVSATTRGARSLLLGLGLLTMSLVPVVPLVAQATTIIVNTTVDSLTLPAGACSLRAAILAANTNTAVGGCLAGSATVTDTIILPCGTYTLSIAGANEDANATGDLDIAGDLIITGAGARTTIIDGSGIIDQVFEIRTGTVTISDMTITGGRADFGGGILVQSQGTLTVNKATVSGNTATDSGGGIFSFGKLTLDSSTVSGNTAATGTIPTVPTGGGITGYLGTVSLTNSTVSGNVAKYGGGIITSNNLIILELSNSTVSANIGYGGGGGGGVYLGQYTEWRVRNTIVAGNLSGGDSRWGSAASSLPASATT